MKKLFLCLMATSTLALAAPAFAHDGDGDDFGYRATTYQEFGATYQHICQGIQHGLDDGAYNRWQAGRFYRELRGIWNRAEWEQREGGYDPEDIGARLNSLHERMHIAHEQGHERLNNAWDGGPYRGGDYDGVYGGFTR